MQDTPKSCKTALKRRKKAVRCFRGNLCVHSYIIGEKEFAATCVGGHSFTFTKHTPYHIAQLYKSMATTQPRTGSPLPADRRWSPSHTPFEDQQEACACPPPAVSAAAETKVPRRRKGRTLHDIVTKHPGPDGKVGFTFRELCPTLHVAAESLRAALINPGRLSVEAVVALAGLMNEDPLVLLDKVCRGARDRSGRICDQRQKVRVR